MSAFTLVIILLTVSPVPTLPSGRGRIITFCPTIDCMDVYIPPECVEPTYLIIDGKYCRGCDRNICRNGYRPV
ncbi:hypothetical protein ACJMK2_043229 [Sinanodonta woodiana]|uniref:Uncharacterized protein n=1 Tax=Sinanodonta woodiana TaxID=1069815 RepID=A0ABD3VWA5_SINWO